MKPFEIGDLNKAIGHYPRTKRDQVKFVLVINMEKRINITDQWDFCVDYMWKIATIEFDDGYYCVCGFAVPLPPAVDKGWILESFCFYIA